METFIALVSVLSISLFGLVLSLLLTQKRFTEFVFTFFLIVTCNIILIGFLLSVLNRISYLSSWCLVGLIELVGLGLIVGIGKRANLVWLSLQDLSLPVRELVQDFRQSDPFQKAMIGITLASIGLLGCLNLVVLIKVAPHEWDSLSYHLSRMAYYLQQSSLGYYPANDWAQIIHPKDSTVLFIYLYLVSLRNDHLLQLIQFIAYWITLASIFSIAREIGSSRIKALFAAIIFGLLIQSLMQATTTQNDLLVTAYLGIFIYFILLGSRENARWRFIQYTGLACLSLCIALGTKFTVIYILPILAGLVLYFTWKTKGKREKLVRLLIFLVLLASFASLLVAPAGYLDNYRLFGHPIRPEKLSSLFFFEPSSPASLVKVGIKNTIRYGLDFLSLDGLKGRFIQEWQPKIKGGFCDLVLRLGIDLEGGNELAPYSCRRNPYAHEAFSYWGILGFGLVWPMVVLVAFKRKIPPKKRVFALASLAFFLLIAFSGPYRWGPTRYFSMVTVLALPLTSVALRFKHPLFRTYLAVVILLGCFSAFYSVIYRDNRSMVSYNLYLGQSTIPIKSIFLMNRLEQMSSLRAGYLDIISKYEELVPKDATVALDFSPLYFEYPFFGEKLTRRIIPVNSFWTGRQPIPPDADYLLFDADLMPPQPTDILLGVDSSSGKIYLRKLRQ